MPIARRQSLHLTLSVALATAAGACASGGGSGGDDEDAILRGTIAYPVVDETDAALTSMWAKEPWVK